MISEEGSFFMSPYTDRSLPVSLPCCFSVDHQALHRMSQTVCSTKDCRHPARNSASVIFLSNSKQYFYILHSNWRNQVILETWVSFLLSIPQLLYLYFNSELFVSSSNTTKIFFQMQRIQRLYIVLQIHDVLPLRIWNSILSICGLFKQFPYNGENCTEMFYFLSVQKTFIESTLKCCLKFSYLDLKYMQFPQITLK